MKIDIIGSVASGKTTLAKRISRKYGIPYYEKDNIVWKRTLNGDVKRNPEERDKYFYDIINENNWIVEGSPRKILKESFGCCDYIIVLDEYTIIRMIRVFKRWINQRSGRESYNSKPTWNFLWCNIKWVLEFNQMKRGLLQELSIFGEKVKIFKHSYETYNCIITASSNRKSEREYGKGNQGLFSGKRKGGRYCNFSRNVELRIRLST